MNTLELLAAQTRDVYGWTNKLIGSLSFDKWNDTPEVIDTNGSELFVWSGDGTLMPGFPRSVDAFQGGINSWLTAADLDGDGKDEILCAGVGRSAFTAMKTFCHFTESTFWNSLRWAW